MNRKIWISALVIIILAAGGFIYKNRTSATAAKATVTVTRGTVLQDVSLTGKTKSMSRVDLAFERSGRVTQVAAKTGDKVKVGQLLIQLDAGELAAQLHQAQAALDAQQAHLDELNAGTRPETILLAQNDVQNAAQTLANYYNDAANTLADAYQKSDDAVRTKTLGMFSGNIGQLYSATYYTCEEGAKTDAQTQRGNADYILARIQKDVTDISATTDATEKERILADAASQLTLIKQFLDVTRVSIANQCLQNDATVAVYRTNISLAITNLVTAQTAVQALQQNIVTQKLALSKLQNTLALQNAGVVPDQIKAQEAQVASAAATVQLYSAQLAKFALRSPIDGTVTFLDIQRGEIAAPNATVATVIAPNALEIEAQVPEVDVGKLAVGNDVAVTFDAIGSDNFPAHVSFIDPAETIIDGVVNYKIVIALQTEDARVKSGLTANLTIHAQKKENVLTLPEYTISEEDAGAFVQKIVAGAPSQKTKITMGMRGTNGVVEITSGLAENDQVESVGLK